MANFFNKFILNIPKITESLRQLLRTNVEWNWSKVQKESLEKLRSTLANVPTLKLFNGKNPIEIYVDASQKGLGACLIQNKHPVTYASRSLTECEQRYAQIEKEMLAICFSLSKFHQFLNGRKIKIITDHKPLVSIIQREKVNQISYRLQRMKLKDNQYNKQIEYITEKNNVVADLLSRSYLKHNCKEDKTIRSCTLCNQ